MACAGLSLGSHEFVSEPWSFLIGAGGWKDGKNVVPPMEAGRIKGASGKKSFVICSRSILKGRSLREEDKAKVNRVLRLSLNQL